MYILTRPTDNIRGFELYIGRSNKSLEMSIYLAKLTNWIL